MLTIFTIPKSFKGHINIIQRNAIQSWLRIISPKPEIILFGNDEGVAEAAKEFNILHVPEIKKNELGTPFLDSALNLTKELTKNPFLGYISADIILMDNLVPAIQQIKSPLFLLCGRRYDFDVKNPVRFDKKNWRDELYNKVIKNTKLRRFTSDYFIFPRNLLHNFPPFLIGRPGWDNWLIFKVRSLKVPVIDATKIITTIHQSHDYSHSPWGKEGKLGGRVEGPEFKRNLTLAGGPLNLLTMIDADWILTSQGLQRPEFPRIIFSKLSLFYPWRVTRVIRRKFRQFFS